MRIMTITKERMPALFVGHGSPMNAIEDNTFTRGWEQIAREIPRPEAILAISAHWYTGGTRIMDEALPKMIYDMYGFPKELYEVRYPAVGAPAMAHLTYELISQEVKMDNSWGYDHGTWSVLRRMYPEADIPVYQLSVDRNAGPEVHFQIGREIRALRTEGVLIVASGNVVHNLSKISWDMQGGYPWAQEFDDYIKEKITNRQFEEVIRYEKAGECSKLAVPTADHFYPLLYALGAADEEDTVTVYNDSCLMGSMSMTSYLFK